MVGDGAPRRANNRGGMKFPHKSLAGGREEGWGMGDVGRLHREEGFFAGDVCEYPQLPWRDGAV